MYNYNGVQKINEDLKNGWRIPTKEDWDNLLVGKPIEYPSTLTIEEVEKELAKLEQEGWRLDRICGFRRFEFVKSSF